MKLFTMTSVAAALAMSVSAGAQTLAITNATIHTATEQGVLKDASVLVKDGKIVAVNPAQIDADEVIDAQGKILTPGFIGSLNHLGLVEVGAVAGSRDGSDKKASITFDPSLAFNPRSSLIPYARKGGITRDVIVPGGSEDIFNGLASVVSLSGEFDSVSQKHVALAIELGQKSKGSRALSMQTLIEKLEGHKQREKKDSDAHNREIQVLDAIFSKEMPLLVGVSRAAEMLELLKLKAKYDIKMVFAGAHDAVLIADQLAASNTPVIISAMDNLPGNFDSMHADLANAGKLEKAGVKVILTIAGDSAHNLYQLRFDAGNAVSYGMSQQGAMEAISSNVAEVFNIDAGAISAGKAADLVLWSADPFELNAKIESIWIDGEKVSTEARQDKLRERYTTPSDMPRGYTK
ncbi:amidohydrolase family protein [Pseudoalteromonas sp. T1lg75]|uniref:amidohydrolase family protein n=1 Tax=Pseudoalteromonas sp. T1lg75 TaxID=2077102 RepID=UPI000CF5E149|nr:amidohydrolase family protein [Pseudoalteromonas sp. T1lg75]